MLVKRKSPLSLPLTLLETSPAHSNPPPPSPLADTHVCLPAAQEASAEPAGVDLGDEPTWCSLPVGGALGSPSGSRGRGKALCSARGRALRGDPMGWGVVLPEHRGQQVVINNGSLCFSARSPGCPLLFSACVSSDPFSPSAAQRGGRCCSPPPAGGDARHRGLIACPRQAVVRVVGSRPRAQGLDLWLPVPSHGICP